MRPLAKGMIDYGVGDAFLLVGVFYCQWMEMKVRIENLTTEGLEKGVFLEFEWFMKCNYW